MTLMSVSMILEDRHGRSCGGVQPKRMLSVESVRSIDDSLHIKGPFEPPSTSSSFRPSKNSECSIPFVEDSHSKQVLPDNSLKFPKLLRAQILEGKILGKGAICYVHEVRGFRNLPLIRRPSRKGSHRVTPVTSEVTPLTVLPGLSDHNLSRSVHSQQIWINASERDLTEDKSNDQEVDGDTQQSRIELLTHRCFREGGDARYAIKVFCTETMNNPSRLAHEAHILSNLTDHTNIIKMRALCQETPLGETCDHFILMDRLYDTLEKRIKTWKRDVDELTGIRASLSWRDPGGAKKVKIYEERVTVAYGLSSALSYIHRNRIIHRDLKPDNMGFDIQGVIKVCWIPDTSLIVYHSLLTTCGSILIDF